MNRRIGKISEDLNLSQKEFIKNPVYFIYNDQNEIGTIDQDNNTSSLRILSDTETAEIGSAVFFEIDNQIFVPIYDFIGNVIALEDLYANQAESYSYGSFGECKIYDSDGQEESFSKINNSWQYLSKRTDRETSLIFFGRRYYDPNIGRWLTCDPLGFEDGLNLYAYVSNDPLINYDLYGLYANPWMFPEASAQTNDAAGAVFHKTAGFAADTINFVSDIGFGLSSPFLYTYRSVAGGSFANDYQNHLLAKTYLQTDIQNLMQTIMPVNQQSKAYQIAGNTSDSVITGMTLGSGAGSLFRGLPALAAGALNTFERSAQVTKSLLARTRFNMNQIDGFSQNRAYSGIDVEKIVKDVKKNIHHTTISYLNNLDKNKFNIKTLKKFKQLVNDLSKSGSKLSQRELHKLRMLTNNFGGKVRLDLKGVKGCGVNPHAHVENLGNKIKHRHIWLEEGVE